MGLLEDDSEWIFSLKEVSLCGSAKQLRSTFAVILQYCRPTEPRKLFDEFLECMSDDIIHQMTKRMNCKREALDEKKILNLVLVSLDEELRQMGGSIMEFGPITKLWTENILRGNLHRSSCFYRLKLQENSYPQCPWRLWENLGPKSDHCQDKVRGWNSDLCGKYGVSSSKSGRRSNCTFKIQNSNRYLRRFNLLH